MNTALQLIARHNATCLRKARAVRTKLAAAVEGREVRVARALRAVFAEHARAIAKKIVRQVASAPRRLANKVAVDLGLRKDTVQNLVQEILESLDLESFGSDVVDEIAGELRAMHREGSSNGLKQVGLAPTDEIVHHLDAQAREYVASRGAELVGKKRVGGKLVDNSNAKWSILETTRKALRGVLTDSVEQGWSSKFLADAIESSDAFDEARALMIARTELAFAHVAGNVAGWRESGEVEGKRWILGDLHPEPDECDENADAGVIDLDEDFPSGDDFPPAHPNCMCDVVPVLAGEAEAEE